MSEVVPADDFTRAVSLLWDSLRLSKNPTEDYWLLWTQITDDTIVALDVFMSMALSRFQRRKCQTSMAHLLTIQAWMERALQQAIQGEGLQQEDNTEMIRWSDLGSAFESRLKTGVIINITHKDINSFMVAAETVFVQNIRPSMSSTRSKSTRSYQSSTSVGRVTRKIIQVSNIPIQKMILFFGILIYLSGSEQMSRYLLSVT